MVVVTVSFRVLGVIVVASCNIQLFRLLTIMEYGSTPYVGMAWEKNGVHI